MFGWTNSILKPCSFSQRLLDHCNGKCRNASKMTNPQALPFLPLGIEASINTVFGIFVAENPEIKMPFSNTPDLQCLVGQTQF